jgi:hypothetical protein
MGQIGQNPDGERILLPGVENGGARTGAKVFRGKPIDF